MSRGARRLGGPRRPGSPGARLPPLSLDPLRALGRSGGALVQRRSLGRRRARPQRPAPAAVPEHEGRTGRRRLRGRRGDDGRPPTWSSAAGSVRARCSWSTPRAASCFATPTPRLAVARKLRLRASRRPGAGPASTPPHGRGSRYRRRYTPSAAPSGWSAEDVKFVLQVMAETGAEPVLLDGRRHSHRAPGPHTAAALRTPAPALRPGHQPGHRPPREKACDVAAVAARRSRRGPSSPRWSTASCAASTILRCRRAPSARARLPGARRGRAGARGSMTADRPRRDVRARTNRCAAAAAAVSRGTRGGQASSLL